MEVCLTTQLSRRLPGSRDGWGSGAGGLVSPTWDMYPPLQAQAKQVPGGPVPGPVHDHNAFPGSATANLGGDRPWGAKERGILSRWTHQRYLQQAATLDHKNIVHLLQ